VSRGQRLILVVLALIVLLLLCATVIMVRYTLGSLPLLFTPAPTLLPVSCSSVTPVLTRTSISSPTPRPTCTPKPTSILTEPLSASSTPTRIVIPTRTPVPAFPPHLSTPTPCFAPTLAPGREFATLDDFWNGNAEWVVETYDVGLPIGESDTVYRGRGELWSFLNTDYHRMRVEDSCGDEVPYPGCVTLWKSRDGGRSFRIERPVCLFPCQKCPCAETDHVQQQQYPRVFFDTDRVYIVYEWGGGTFMRTSDDAVHWSGEIGIPGTGVWDPSRRPCTEAERVGAHPYVDSSLEFDCLAGAPPGIYVEGDLLYIFVGLGRAPGHLGCFVVGKDEDMGDLRPCESNPLFTGETEYGPLGALGVEANRYFDFRTISSADVVRVGDHYYMAYEGTRGPSSRSVREDQFALGFARSISSTIDGPWEKYAGNPAITDLGDNWGIGHADIVIVGRATYLYTSTSPTTRGRYVLVRK
jgi:hypothetical protein